MKKFLTVLAATALAFSIPAHAEVGKSKSLGTFNSWTAYVFSDGGNKVCYIAAQPASSQGKYKIRDDVFLTVTHRPSEKTYDVVSVIAGFTYKKGSTPNIRMDKNQVVNLIPVADVAWAKDEKTDKKLVQQMIAGSNAYVNGTSARGTKITDTFSLKGFSKAYQAINKACGK